jgi:isoquinoline 1-oxidoreductase
MNEFERYELREGPAYRFELDRRAFFEIAGAGIAVALLLPRTEAQESGRRGGGGAGRGFPAELSAWIHIGEDGRISVFTGKAEVGQNTRTALSQAVADELRVPLEAVDMVMADTDRVPFDMGTFGSMSTPVMSPQLRRAAATARQALVEMAAQRWNVDASGLRIGGGEVREASGGRRAAYGELAKGQKLLRTVTADAAVTPASAWTVAGRSARKVNGRAMVTGDHKYTTDLKLDGMLHGKVLRPPAMGAKLLRADTAKARAIPGVTVVEDRDFIGVTAPTAELAAQAIAAIHAEWERPPQISDAGLFEHLEKSASPGRAQGSAGSFDAGLAAAHITHRARYTIAYIAHAPLEPRAAVAQWTGGKLTVWTGTQRPFGVKGQLAQELSIPESSVRVIVPDTGSGYGGKHTGEQAVEAARLAKAAGRPVKLVWTREEEFSWAYYRPAGVITVRSGLDADGRLTAWEFHNYNSGGSAIRTLYEVPNQKIEFHESKSPLRQGSYRALAATANHFARESHMDELAAKVKMDPLEFRLRNLKDERFRDALQAAAKAFGWQNRAKSKGVGFGIAGGFEKAGYVATCAEVRVEGPSQEVKVVRLVTAFDCGAVVNPDHLKSQIEGAVVQGIGGALFEAAAFQDGVIQTRRFSSYRVPRFRDLPAVEVVLMDRKDRPAVGAGETPIVAVAPAIANAIFDAAGQRVRSMPLAPRGLRA